MDFTELKVQLEAARLVEVGAAGAVFKLRLPSDHAWRNALESNRDSAGRVLETRAMRMVLDTALTGWSGVTARHFLPEAAEDPVECTPAARAELLDVRQDIADVLTIALAEKRRERREKQETARKN